MRRPSPLKTIPPLLSSLPPRPPRPAHPISPPGRRRVSSSALALQTAQKHLARVEGTRARQDRMWKEAGGELGDEGSASRKTTCRRRRRREEKECQLPAPAKRAEGLGPRGRWNSGENLRKHFCSDGVRDESRCSVHPCTPPSPDSLPVAAQPARAGRTLIVFY